MFFQTKQQRAHAQLKSQEYERMNKTCTTTIYIKCQNGVCMDRNTVPSLVDELLFSYSAEKSQAYFIEMVVPLLNQPDSKERPSTQEQLANKN